MDAELVIPTRGLVECSLVPVMEGFQEEEKVSTARLLVQFIKYAVSYHAV